MEVDKTEMKIIQDHIDTAEKAKRDIILSYDNLQVDKAEQEVKMNKHEETKK